MWTTRIEALPRGRGQRIELHHGGRCAPVSRVLAGWRDEPGLRELFSDMLASRPYTAVKWETPAVTAATLEQPFECVVLGSPGLARAPDPHAFAEHFAPPPTDVVRFANLGRDAVMVVPCPRVRHSAYGHLLAFLRDAPRDQQHELWRQVALAMDARVSERPVWLSTAGGGVSWLHVRLDDRPKYYGHGPYRQGGGGQDEGGWWRR